ncbi:MAG: outer membrane lipoprotein-sorting protein [Acidimicrobiia bacterium]|nr:outer membrane lipoprotein-sorting protein [Acidimicrobiia bacterium]
MSRALLALPVALLAVAVSGTVAAPQNRSAGSAGRLTAEAVVRRAQDRDTGRDSVAEMRMRLFDRQGRVRERQMRLSTLRGSGGEGDRTLARFTYPSDIKDTALLVREHEAEDDERFLYLPALGRVRRIAGAEKEESFAGSDLSYEDVGSRTIGEYAYAFLDERATWTGADGVASEAWLIESRAKDAGRRYQRSTSLILKDSLVMVRGEQFDRHGDRGKLFEVTRLDRVDGIWTVMALTVANEAARTRTELETTSIRYNVGLTGEDFSRRRLEQPR